MVSQKDYDDFSKELRPYKWHGLYHYTDFSNFVEIMKAGEILCRHEAKKRGLIKWDMAKRDIVLPIGIDLSEYVHFYYTSKPTMLYEAEGIKVEEKSTKHLPIPVIFLCKPNLICDEDVLFADGESENRNSFFYENLKDARNKIDWRTVFKTLEIDPEEYYEARVRSAEFLYPGKISLDDVEAIIFRTQADYKNALNMCGFDPRYMVDKTKFYNYKGWNNVGVGSNRQRNVYNYLMDYDISVEGKQLELKYAFASDEIRPFEHEFKITYESGTEQIDDSNYSSNATEWTLEEDIIKDEPFEVSYKLNGHRVIYWKSENQE